MGVGVVYRHLDEIYKRRLLDQETPRRGDVAEIVKDHCVRETGMKVSVVNDPHWCEVNCHSCGQKVVGWFVEIVPTERVKDAVGPFFYPLKWLRRVGLNGNVGYRR